MRVRINRQDKFLHNPGSMLTPNFPMFLHIGYTGQNGRRILIEKDGGQNRVDGVISSGAIGTVALLS